jgi:hypothetical protein
MKKTLLKSKILAAFLFFAFSYTSVKAQCSITATTNTSALTCGTAPLSACGGILYIGNGTTAMSLNMNADLDLTCLGAIQFIVRNNATLDFDAGSNKNLQLAAGSSIVFESGSAIKSVNSCGASDLITIGGAKVASCNGGSAILSFTQIVSQGGYSPINASASPSTICGSGSSTITATATPSAGATYRWYTAATGGTLLQSSSSNTYSTGTISSTTTYYVEAHYASASPAYTTVRKAVTVTVLPTFSLTSVFAIAAICTTSKTSLVTVSSTASALPVGTYTVTYSLSYNSYSTSYTASMSVTTAGSGQFTANLGIMGTNNSTIIRVTNLSSGGCSNSISSGNDSNTVNMYSPIKPNITNIYSDYPVCSTSKVQWQNDTFVSGYFLDVATTNNFAAGTYVSGYQDLNVGNVIAYDVTGLTPGTTYYYRVRNNNLGCGISENSDVKSFTTGGIAAPGSITGSALQCPSMTGQVYSTSAVAGAIGYSWNVPSGWTITSGWNTTSITVTTGSAGGNVSVAAMSPVGGCYSEAKVLAVTMNGATFTTSPSSPVCRNVDVTYTTQSGKTSYAWTISGSLGTDYTISAGGTTTNSVTLKWLTTGSKTVTVNYSGACSAAATNTVTVNAIPATPGTITQPTNKCAGSTGNVFSIASVTGAISYTWSVTGTGWSVTSGGSTASATITIGSGVGTVSVTATNACGTSSASTTGNITPTTAPATPGAITQPTNKCASSTGNVFSIASVTGATSYTWSVTGTGWSVTSGGSTASATITIGSGVGTVSVTATNACGTSSASTTGNITPSTAPATPGAITQPTDKCAGSTGNIFSIASVTGATSYTWSVTGTGWSVTSGGSTASATITIGSGVGTVSVTATNACGTSSASTTGNITPTTAPATPGAITQPTNKCASSTGNVFSIASVTGATSYTWSVTGTGWSVTSGGSTASATITIGSGVGTVSVTATNACGTSSASTTGNITPSTAPVTPGAITQPTNICASSTGNVFSIASVTGATSYTWLVTGTGWSVTSGGSTASATITVGSGIGTVSVTATNACGTSSASTTGNITPSTAPATPGTITQPTNICASSTGNVFSIASVTGATSYTWSVTGTGWSVTSGGSTASATITVGSGIGTVSVTATNACGTSSASTTGNITPTTAPTITAISSPSALCPGGSLNPSAPTVTNNGSVVTGSGWEISTTSGGSTYTALSLPYTVAYADNGKNIRYYTTNGCGTTYSNVVALIVNPLPGTPTATAPTDVTCSSFLANWTAATNATGYYLDVSTVNNFSAILPAYNGLDIGLVSSYNVTGLTKKTTYFYRLRAYNSCSTSVSSNYIQIKTLDVPKATISGTTNVCINAASPAITFTNSEDSPITVTYNINGGSNLTINVGANSTATVSVPTGNPGTFVYNLVSAVYQSVTSCFTILSGSATVTVNTEPTPTFTTPALAQTCADEHITYTTQSGFSNYVWTVSGTLNTDYKLIDRGTLTDNYIVIEWLTVGTKTVTVNYNNSNGCSGATTAIYTTQVTVLDRGRVIGGAHICKGSPLPTLTLRNDAGNSIYPDSSSILKWQYSDELNNTNWQDIAGTAGQTSHTPTAFPGAFRTYQVLLKNGNCTKTSIESRINIDAFNAPTSGTTTYPTCSVSTGSVVLNNLPSGNWTINQTGAATTTYPNTVANTTSYTVTGLAAGTYTFTVTEGNCTSDASLPLVIKAGNTWDGSKWSKTGDTTLPTAGDKIVFEGNYILTTDLTGCSCTVNSGNVVINSGITLTITNAVTVNGGSLTFENNASLLQTTNAVNSGAIVYKRTSFPMKNFDATYWSSPVVGQTLVGLSPNTLSDKYLSYYDSAWKTEVRTNVMKPGVGYGIRVPKPNFWPVPTATTYAQPVEFKGVPNNGDIVSSQAITAGKYYLIGNPYPSALDARAFLFTNVNNNTVLNGTIYFWTHNTGITPSGTKYVYSSNDYASFNATGGTATTGTNDAEPSGYIAAGQSFMASAKASGTVVFNNSMRAGGSNNGQFFKPGKTSKSPELERHRLWLNMTNSGGAFKQTLIGYIDGATNNYDIDFDGETFDGNSYIDFYSINTTNKLTIQGRALPFTDTDLVPLGYRSTIAGDFTISINKADGNLAAQRIYLEDKQTATINELTAGNYTFTTKAGTFNDRFVLRYTNGTLGTGDFETTDDSVLVLVQNKKININSTVENIDKVFIYDISGNQLYQKESVNNLQLIIENLASAQQVLLVKIVLDNGYQTTKKVIFK